ncbi:histone-lysine N-methyltransferase SETD2-like isoform X2 [Oculina patagonica]
MSAEERSDNSGHTDDSGSDSEEDVSGEHVISSTEEYQPPYYEHVEENVYLFDRKKKVNKEVRRMQCDCTLDADYPDSAGCGEDCLNRLLMIECNSRCTCGEMCSNKRFQQGCKVKVEVFKTENKGWGLKTLEDLEPNQFVMEYCGEVMNYKDFSERAERYDRENRRHYYFMTLRADEIIDATFKGNLSRFINHSCDSNCETQKWTVNGLLRIGFFTQRFIPARTELTFDYKLQRYGKTAQICYCEAPNCRGFIGGEKQTPLKNTVERIATPPITSSPRRRRKKPRNLTSEFDDITLEDEVEKLLGDQQGLVHGDQALKLSRLMVRAETTDQRIMLLKILQHTTDQSCLKAFLRFQGLSLLWSWMIDGGGKRMKLKMEVSLLDTLKHLPIATKNQLEDSKVIKVVRKWALSSCPTVEAGSSSGQESHGNSPADSECTAGTEDNDDDNQHRTKPLEIGKKLVGSPLIFERQCSNKDQSDDDSLDAEVASFIVNKSADSGAVKSKMAAECEKSPDELSEDDVRSEDERLPETGVGMIANELLKSWSLLKEVYKIPKKSATPAKQDRVTELAAAACSPAGSADGDHSRTPVEHISSPGKLDAIMKSLQNSPKPLFPLESRTPPASQGFSTCSEETDEQKSSANEPPPTKAGDFSSLEFDDDMETKESSTPDKEDVTLPLPLLSDPVDVSQDQDTRSQNAMQTFGYQQRMNFNVEHGFGQQKPKRNKKKNKKWNQNQMQNFFQQQGRNVQGLLDNNFGNIHMNPQTNFGPQQNMTQWRGPSQNAPPNYQGNQFYCGGPTIGQDQGPRPQHLGQGNFVGNFNPQGPALPNFNVPPPNMPPMEFFRKVPPPNFSQQNQPMMPQQPQQTPHIPPQPVPPPPLQANQSQFFSPSQPPPYTRLPPPPPFQANVSTPPPPQFQQPNVMQQQQHPRSMQPGFPPQQNQFPYNSPPPQLSIPPAQQISPVGKLPIPLQHRSGLPEAVPHPEVAPFSLQTGAVTTSSTGSYECSEGFGAEPEPCTPSPVKHKPTHLPPHWKSATDQQGKVYYYHALTRKTQWDLPSWDSSPSSEEEHPCNVTEPENTSITPLTYTKTEESPSKAKVKKMVKTPTTPPGTPPESPTLAYTTAAADTTDTAHQREEHMIRDDASTGSSSHHKIREMFRMKLSNVVVNCLNPFFKVDCKSGRILNTDDFKFLARKLTHGILMKELSHLKDEETLQCNDSVKIKTKEYIRSYMKKFGPVYKRS